MALFKRGNIWWMEITNAAGKTVRESCSTKDRETAEMKQELRRNAILIGSIPGIKRTSGKTWKDASDRFLAEHSDKRSAKDDKRFAAWWDDKLDGMTLAQLDRDTLNGLVSKKRAESSSSTANRYRSYLSAVLHAAKDDYGWIDSIPKVKKFDEPKGIVRFLTVDKIDTLLAQLPQHQRDMAEFALSTGIRQAAVKRLEWSAVNLDRGICWVVPEDSKSGEPIAVPLNDAGKAVLARCVGKHPKRVFTYNGNPVNNVNTAAWKKALKRSGLEGWRWHDLRHTWASHHAMNGTPMKVLKELGGWHDTKMVERYAHMSAESLAQYVGNAARATEPVYRGGDATVDRLAA